MHICGQTLILVDNDSTVSEVNMKLVKATLKYLFYHRPDDRTFALSTYEHDISDDEVYETDTDELVYKADSLEFAAKDSNLSDTLSEVIARWKESDFACRDILVFTDGLESDAFFHEKEELYYLLENSDYPVYIVMLDQENNTHARKGLSAIAVTSGGKLFETEFPGSEAAVDRQLCEQIFSSMDEYELTHWMAYEETGKTAGEEENADEKDTASGEEMGVGKGTGAETVNEEVQKAAGGEVEEITQTVADAQAPDYMTGVSDEIMFERGDNTGFLEGPGALILSGALIICGIMAGIIGSFMIMKKKRIADRAIRPGINGEEEYFEDYEIGGMNTVMLDERDLFDSATRLLDGNGRMVTLTEKGGTGRSFRIVVGSPMSIGRGHCDVVISGDDALSKKHCELYESEGDIYVRDLSSANGTRVNNVRVSNQRLSDGDELTMGAGTYLVGIV